MAKAPRDAWEKEWQDLSKTALDQVSAAAAPEELEAVRLSLVGRKGRLTALLKDLKDLPIEKRRLLGPEINGLKDKVTAALDARRGELDKARLDAELAGSRIDPTLPAAALPRGGPHPLTETMRQMTRILSQLGFSWADGPLVETDHYNFEALNIPADHPARDMQDTFYIAQGDINANGKRTKLLLRTHTSPVQIRYMENHAPPIRIMAPGRVFRHEAVDASHSAVFHQVEGLYVDRGVTMADLKGTLQVFLKNLLGPRTETRFRPSYFPFTEPSAEVDVKCLFCAGSGCSVCKRSGWLEMLGAGLVHPKVLACAGLEPREWSGYAFGIGVERVAMLLSGIPDIRMFYENDLRLLGQFE